MRSRLVAEAFGTFCLVFAGAGALTSGMPLVGVGIAFGLAAMAMVYAVGDVSGAHINPAVTIGFWAARRLPASSVGPYIAAQCVGALAASLLIEAAYPRSVAAAVTAPSGDVWASFLLEVVLTAILMFTVLSVTSGPKERGAFAGQVIGAVIALEVICAGAVSGASMNPARSLGPAIAGGRLDALWVYLAAPSLGALVAVPLCRCAGCGVESGTSARA